MFDLAKSKSCHVVHFYNIEAIIKPPIVIFMGLRNRSISLKFILCKRVIIKNEKKKMTWLPCDGRICF